MNQHRCDTALEKLNNTVNPGVNFDDKYCPSETISRIKLVRPMVACLA